MSSIEKIYRYIWETIFGRDEPFTHSMRRNAKKNWLWWLLIPIVLGGGWYALVFHLGGFF